jgi:dTDP-4-dehydrorhamnose reductase
LADYFAERHEVIELCRAEWELSTLDFVARLRELDFDALLNPAANTSLEVCEDEPELARRVNAEAPVKMAAMCRESGRRILHFSTDYVLSGEVPGLHGEDSPIGPISVYGRTKADAERGVLEEGGCVMRVSWVFGRERPAFPEQVMARALAGEALAAIADKTSLPVYTRDLAAWVEAVVESGFPNQIIHACNSGEPASWHDLAEEVVDFLLERGELKERPDVLAQSLADMAGFRAARPRHTAMATPRLSAILGNPPRCWREALREHLEEHLISR